MIYAERGNRVKQISESEVQKYVEQGYKITDDRGTVIRETVPMDVQILKAEYQKHVDEIKSLKAQNELLTLELTKAKDEIAKLTKVELDANEAVQPEEQKTEKSKKALVIEEQPKQTRSKKVKVVESAPEAE